MQIREHYQISEYQISEFKVTDDQGNEYTLFENRNGAETRSLKWLVADGTPVDRIDDQTFRIATNDTVLHRRG